MYNYSTISRYVTFIALIALFTGSIAFVTNNAIAMLDNFLPYIPGTYLFPYMKGWVNIN